jgi:hypothetical protein
MEPPIARQDPEPDKSKTRRAPARLGGRWTAASLAAAGLAAMMASELMPWTTLHIDRATGNASGNDILGNLPGLNGAMTFGLDRLHTFDVFAYQIAMLGVLALLGALLFGRVQQRRAVFGAVLGLLAAQALTLAGMIHSFAHLLDDYLGAAPLPGSLHTTVEPGAYFAVVGLVLLLASLLVTAAPERVRAQLSDVMREPVDAQYTDEPFELTVTQAKPIDETYFNRPDHRR